MQPVRAHPQRAPGSFSPLRTTNAPGNSSDQPPSRPGLRKVESSDSDASSIVLNIAKSRTQTSPSTNGQSQNTSTPIYASFTNSSTTSLQNFSRPSPSTHASQTSAAAAAIAARSVTNSHESSRNASSPLTQPPSNVSESGRRGHGRKHSQTAGAFEANLPSITTSNLSNVGMPHPSPVHRELSASQIAAQAAVMNSRSQQNQQLQQQQAHLRQRSQTVPVTDNGSDTASTTSSVRRGPGPLSPPILSLTEASAPRESGFGGQGYHNGLLGNQAAAMAANVVFPRSGQTSPGTQAPPVQAPPPPPPPPPPPLPEKKSEKSSKVKLFSRPGKISIKTDTKDTNKPLPSPSKIGSALSALQRGNFSTTSLDSSSPSFYSLANSSSVTIKPAETPIEEKGKEKKHHFLSRQKNKNKDKEDYHLPLSSAASNSRPSDPNAPTSLYNFSVAPSSPGPGTAAFKSMSGLDLRHGGRALREKRKEDKAEQQDYNNIMSAGADWPGPGSFTSHTNSSAIWGPETLDPSRYGLSSLSPEDAWPYLRAKLLTAFEGGDTLVPVEDLNRVVTLHIRYCIQRNSPNMIIDDVRDMLKTGFTSLDHTLRATPEDRFIPAMVELWMYSYVDMMALVRGVLLPLDLELAGEGTLMTPEQAQEFWGGIVISTSGDDDDDNNEEHYHDAPEVAEAARFLDVFRLVMVAYRDVIILPRYEKLKAMFSRLALEALPQFYNIRSPTTTTSDPSILQQLSTSPSGDSNASFGGMQQQQQQQQRPGTSMSLDPSTASYNSTSTTLLGDVPGGGNRSRAISNVSFASSGDRGSTGTGSASGGGAGGGGGGGSGSGINMSGGIGTMGVNGNGPALLRPFPIPYGHTGAMGPPPHPRLSHAVNGSILSLGKRHDGGYGYSGMIDDFARESATAAGASGGAPGGIAGSASTMGGGAGGNTSVGGGDFRSTSSVSDDDASKQITALMGRMLQCMGLLCSATLVKDGSDDGVRKVEELCRLLKLNWLGRGRTGRNRRGMVGGRVRPT